MYIMVNESSDYHAKKEKIQLVIEMGPPASAHNPNFQDSSSH